MMGSMLDPNCVRAKVLLNEYEQGEALTKTGVTHYHAQLGYTDKGRAINMFVFCTGFDLVNGLALR